MGGTKEGRPQGSLNNSPLPYRIFNGVCEKCNNHSKKQKTKSIIIKKNRVARENIKFLTKYQQVFFKHTKLCNIILSEHSEWIFYLKFIRF